MSNDSQNIARMLRRSALLAMAPSWLDKRTCEIGETGRVNKRTVNVTFDCRCNDGKRTTQPVYVGARTCTKSMAGRISEVLHDKHAHHWHTHEAPEPEDLVAAAAAKVARLKNAVTTEKRKSAVLSKALTGAVRQVQAAVPAVKAQAEHKRQDSRAIKRRKPVDPKNTETFNSTGPTKAQRCSQTTTGWWIL
jgi:hypothetical protein